MARPIQDALNAEKLASGVQVTNIIGGGGTIGLAQFVTSKERDPVLLVAGLGMVGAIITNKAAVSGCVAHIGETWQEKPLARCRTDGEVSGCAVAFSACVCGRNYTTPA